MKRLLIGMTVASLLAGCSSTPEAEKVKPPGLTFKQDEQTIQIIPLYDAYQSYVDATFKELTENAEELNKTIAYVNYSPLICFAN
ncbi:hypothetical protein BLD48_08080 [Exiguobacterium sp. KRL4]|uniref:hypothetical protein n=1 Tax=Exiguobacterium sp. KRL4 TaxID=1914536 RepID=UPI0008F87908|nr:hypothetical protein [Exiguobacterium sp. KRL4]OIN66903.1 hypothetical protein BLD48_08080 [Exiguobacterium sp. KRL4]